MTHPLIKEAKRLESANIEANDRIQDEDEHGVMQKKAIIGQRLIDRQLDQWQTAIYAGAPGLVHHKGGHHIRIAVGLRKY